MALSPLPLFAALALLLVAALRSEAAAVQPPLPDGPRPTAVLDARGVPLAGARVAVQIDGDWRTVGVTGPLGELPELPAFAAAAPSVVVAPSCVPAVLSARAPGRAARPAPRRTIVLERAGHLRGRILGPHPGTRCLAWPLDASPEQALEACLRGDPTVPTCLLRGDAFVLRGLDPARRWSVGVLRDGRLRVLARGLEVGQSDLCFEL